MKIIEALKKGQILRIEQGDRFLYWSNIQGTWIVRDSNTNSKLVDTPIEEKAVNCLIYGLT